MLQSEVICDIEGCSKPAWKTIKEGNWPRSEILVDLCATHYTEFLTELLKKTKKKVEL